MRTLAEPLEMKFGGETSVVDGQYIDPSGNFSLFIPEDWFISNTSSFAEKRVSVQHTVQRYRVEVWRVPGTHYRPSPREGCVWAFSDKGLYDGWSESRATNIATCYPISANDDLIFVYLRHWKGSTWQLEGHVSPDVLVEGERETRQLIQTISWLDGEQDQK